MEAGANGQSGQKMMGLLVGMFYVMKCMCKGKVKNSINCENFPKVDIF